MNQAYLIRRGKKVFFDIPESWRLLSFAAFDDAAPSIDIRDAVRRALSHPIGTPPLSKRIKASNRVAILVEDLTRTSPKRILLEVLTETLEAAGLSPEAISIVIALGTHRPLGTEELRDAFGEALTGRYAFYNHDARSTDLVPVATLPSGRPVKINRRVAQADVRIGIGSIFPHPMNGFGGGGKILFPGVADFDAIVDHHLALTFAPGTQLGDTNGNPFHEAITAVARAAGLDFIINSVLDPRDRARDVVAGDLSAAHQAGIEKCRHFITRSFEKPSDLTVTTTFPYSEGPQIIKPLAPASIVTKPGGCIIWTVDIDDRLPEPFIESFERFRARHRDNLYQAVLDAFGSGQLIMEGGAIDFNMALASALALQPQFDIIMVSEDIPQSQAERMGFGYAGKLEDAFAMAAKRLPTPEVHVIPSGGILLPEIKT